MQPLCETTPGLLDSPVAKPTSRQVEQHVYNDDNNNDVTCIIMTIMLCYVSVDNAL